MKPLVVTTYKTANHRETLYVQNARFRKISGGAYGAITKRIQLTSGTEDLDEIIDTLNHEVMHQLLDELFPHAQVVFGKNGKSYYYTGGTAEGSTCRAWDNVIQEYMWAYQKIHPEFEWTNREFILWKNKTYGVS